MRSRQPSPRARLTDEEIRAVALAIRAAAGCPPPDDPRDYICSPMHELPPEDESRVIAVLEGLLAGG